MICKNCQRKFHYCGSCGHDPWNYEGYCSQRCFEESDYGKEIITNINSFLESLSKEQRNKFKHLFDNEIIKYDETVNERLIIKI